MEIENAVCNTCNGQLLKSIKTIKVQDTCRCCNLGVFGA